MPHNPMSPAQSFDPAQAAASLERNHDALPWPQRRYLVKTIAAELSQQGPQAIHLQLLLLLADDPKWEVRKDVADCLLQLDEEDFPRLAARLSRDDNAFVRQAAQMAIDRRRRGRESRQRKRRGLDHVQDQYDTIEQTHGLAAARQAQSLAERLYDILVGATVHDMRNFLGPLKSSVTGLLGHLADGKLETRLFEKNLLNMRRQVEMIERMLEDMRTYSQSTPSHRRRERLAAMIHDAHTAVLDTFKATGRDATAISVSIDVPENLAVEVARFDMVRGLMNLIKNAYEAHATGPDRFESGSVWIQARESGDGRIEILFRDDGMGLSRDELEDVRRFVPGGTSKKAYGTGFGLPTAKRKIEAHGGSIAIESEENKGTTVLVTLTEVWEEHEE